MKRKFFPGIGLWVILLIAICLACPKLILGLVWAPKSQDPYRDQRIALATQMNILGAGPDIPAYYHKVIEQHMVEGAKLSLAEVHHLVQGYDKVIRCPEDSREFYYFYGTTQENSHNMGIGYDAQGNVCGVRSDDDFDLDAPTYLVEGGDTYFVGRCEPGLFSEDALAPPSLRPVQVGCP